MEGLVIIGFYCNIKMQMGTKSRLFSWLECHQTVTRHKNILNHPMNIYHRGKSRQALSGRGIKNKCHTNAKNMVSISTLEFNIFFILHKRPSSISKQSTALTESFLNSTELLHQFSWWKYYRSLLYLLIIGTCIHKKITKLTLQAQRIITPLKTPGLLNNLAFYNGHCLKRSSSTFQSFYLQRHWLHKYWHNQSLTVLFSFCNDSSKLKLKSVNTLAQPLHLC